MSLKINAMSKKYLFILTVANMVVSQCFAEDNYLFGIVPQQDESKLARIWNPILLYLSEKSGHKLKLSTTKNLALFEKKLAIGKYHFSYMNPQQYVVFHKHTGYRAFAKAKNRRIQGIIIVRKDNPIESLKDLNNKRLAFPSALSFGASILPRSEFSKHNIHIIPRYVSSHDAVYRDVATKKFIAGGGILRTFKAAPNEIRKNLRILYKTKKYTPHAFVVHPDVPDHIRNDVMKAMLNMNTTQHGRELLTTIIFEGIDRAENKDWDDVRRIHY